MTLIAVPIMVDDLESALAAAVRAAEHGADLVEFRVDQFWEDDRPIEILLDRSPLPCILTCRDQSEGGGFTGAHDDRAALFDRVAASPDRPAYIDVELACYEQSQTLREAAAKLIDDDARGGGPATGLILSAHDFETRPANLLQIVERMREIDACRVIKIAWRARSLRDNLEAFEIISQRHKPIIALCMGEFGVPSRMLAKKFGALLTFASNDAASTTAPGQPAVSELKTHYRWDAIDSRTNVYGIFGWPVGHSISPHIHNAGFAATAFNGVYVHMPVPPEYEHFKATATAWLDDQQLAFRGASVTAPHKENLIRFISERGGDIEPLAAKIGSANTLTKRDDGSLYASNTDYAAALDSCCNAMSITRDDVKDLNVAIVGGGGVSRAIAAGFADRGAAVCIYNRTLERATAIADAFTDLPGRVTAAPLDRLSQSAADLYINGTPLGMHPNVDDTPMPRDAMFAHNAWREGVAVFDTIYNPVETRLLREAREAGCTTINGKDMFVRQAAGQFELWTNQPAPTHIFEKVVNQMLYEDH